MKLVFFVRRGLDSFIDSIIESLSGIYETRKIIVENYSQIDEYMKWADVCWFEWCDELIAYGSKLELAKEKGMICRLHSYESFTDNINNVKWNNVDRLILICDYIKDFLTTHFNLDEKIISVIPNGIDENKWTFKEQNNGYNIAYVGYINYKKGPMLLLHAFKAIYDKDNRYKLYIAGQFQDQRDILYYNQMVNELDLENNVIYEGWQENLDDWLSDKNYIICTSIFESQNMSVMQAMCKGIKPIIHNFAGAKEIYPSKYVWNTIDEAITMINSSEYNSVEYKKYIIENFAQDKQIEKIKDVIEIIYDKKKEIFETIKYIRENINKDVSFENIEDLTMIIPTINRSLMIKNDLEKGFKLGNQRKLIVDDGSDKENTLILKKLINEKRFGIENVIFHKENKGVAGAVNTAINNIKSKWTMFSGDDDMIFCINHAKFKSSLDELNSNTSVIVPRFVVNVNDASEISLGYDRKIFHNMKCADVLKYIFFTGEMQVLNSGAVHNTIDIKSALAEEIFTVSEDYIMLAKTFGNNLHKKLIISEEYIYVRRVSMNTLSRQINRNKLALHLFSLITSGYYCLKNNLISTMELKEAIKNRGYLIENLYGYGLWFTELLISYIEDKISIEDFINICNENSILENISVKNVPKEFMDIKQYVNMV